MLPSDEGLCVVKRAGALIDGRVDEAEEDPPP